MLLDFTSTLKILEKKKETTTFFAHSWEATHLFKFDHEIAAIQAHYQASLLILAILLFLTHLQWQMELLYLFYRWCNIGIKSLNILSEIQK